MTPEEQKQFEARNRMEELVHAVRAHALTHYNENGWDILVECWDDSDIEKAIGKATTVAGAIANCGKPLGIAASVRADIQAEAF